VTSAELGELVTAAVVVSPQFNPLPILIFTRKQIRDHFIRDGSAGYIRAATISVWINEQSFVHFMKHFIRHTKLAEDPVMLFLNKHSSHLSCQALDSCKANDVLFLSSPQYRSHHLQLQDISVFGPLKIMSSTGLDSQSWEDAHNL
jgi:hypothetical protein